MIWTIGTSEWIQLVAKHDNWTAEESRASNESFWLAYTPLGMTLQSTLKMSFYYHYDPTVVRRG